VVVEGLRVAESLRAIPSFARLHLNQNGMFHLAPLVDIIFIFH
jgi:hypothetical protein